MELFERLPDQWKQELPSAERLLHAIKLPREYIPDEELIFKALELPIPRIKVCILGQDPYPNPEDPMGLAFSVRSQGGNLPPTLRNIYRELESDLGIKNQSGDLSKWHNQGVLLLNRVLTTKPNVSQAHKDLGWQNFTKEVVTTLAIRPIVFVLWGRSAGELASLIPEEKLIVGVHPSPLSAYRGFFGSRPFSEVNQRLKLMGISEIDWKI